MNDGPVIKPKFDGKDLAMDKQHLQERLQRLHAELQHVESVDARGRQVLEQLNGDIQDLLAHSGQHEPHKYTRLGERLKVGVEHFEASHPKVTLLMGQVADMLAKMGI